MFDQYSYKIKFKILIVLFFILSITAYKRSFSKLLDVINENRLLCAEVEKMEKNTTDLHQLNIELTNLDQFIGKEGNGKEKIQQDIIGFITEHGNEINISNLQTAHEFNDGNYKIFTYHLDLTGNFNNLLALTYQFEKKFEYSKIVSLHFYKEKNSNKQDVLHLTTLFQNYENNK